MPDPRFFDSLGPASLGELAQLSGAKLADPDAAGRTIGCVAILAAADVASVSFFSDRKLAGAFAASAAGACFVRESEAALAPAGCAAVLTPVPQAAWAAAAMRLHRPRHFEAGAAAVHPTAELEEGVEVGAGAVIGAGAQIGAGTVIGPGATIGPGVAIGRRCVIGPNAVVGFALVGDGVRLYAGCVIGEAGFGVTPGPRGLIDVPQLGRVILQDNVTIGANSCVDRGAFEDTVIGENSKIDNLVQIAHNVQIGRNCVVAAHSGISGSCVIGDGTMLGGRVGLADHVTIGRGVQLAAASGVMHDIPDGAVWGGIPAKPAKQWLRETAWLTRAAKNRGGREGT